MTENVKRLKELLAEMEQDLNALRVAIEAQNKYSRALLALAKGDKE